MKGSLRIGIVLIILNTLALAMWSRATAPPTDVKPIPRSQRVAILNLTYVLKNYKKFESFQNELKKAVDPFQKRDKEKKSMGEAMAKEMAVTSDATRKAGIERKLRAIERDIEDNKSEATQILQKKQEEQLQELYGDVEKATRLYAKSKGFDLVLHDNDALTDAEKRSPANIARKMQAGSLMPLYNETGVDISKEILAELNERLKRKSS